MITSSDMNSRLKQKQYESHVVDFINNKGQIILLTDDLTFSNVLRTVLYKHLAVSANYALHIISDPTSLNRAIKGAYQAQLVPFLFSECTIGGKDLTFEIQELTKEFPQMHIVMLTIEVERAKLMYLHELKVKNFITKPVSANTLIEKIAFTVKPPSKLGQLIEAARACVELNKPNDAKEICKQVLDLKPGSAAGLMILGDAEKVLGNYSLARQYYEEAAKGNHLFLEPLHRLALLANETGQETEELMYLERLDHLSPLNPERKIAMGEIYYKKGNQQQAEVLFDIALNQVPKDSKNQIAAVNRRIAQTYHNVEPEKAEVFLRRSLAAKGKNLGLDDIRTFNQLGISLRKQSKFEDAIQEYKKALTIAPNDENLYYNCSMAYAEFADFNKASLYMKKALEINNDFVRSSFTVAYNMFIVFINAKDKERALFCITIAKELEPDNQLLKQAQNFLN